MKYPLLSFIAALMFTATPVWADALSDASPASVNDTSMDMPHNDAMFSNAASLNDTALDDARGTNGVQSIAYNDQDATVTGNTLSGTYNSGDNSTASSFNGFSGVGVNINVTGAQSSVQSTVNISATFN